ncbi:MAG: excinuclease ABC subunit UvrC [Chloroflexi bacterium]|nr:excinuclease ABC subunit UvrC [Chloroflexota bacterium]
MDTPFADRLRALSTGPGVYQMKNATGEVIYVGKAASLRDRVRSYFGSARSLEPKTRALVERIADFEVIRTDTAVEALILENELIKRLQPYYNIRLKDDKTYPYIKLTNDSWPRVVITRRIAKDGCRYFGPYTSAGAAQQVIKVIDRLFDVRKCEELPDRACLYYHMHQCLAPCIGLADRAAYDRDVREIGLFLEGRAEEIVADRQRRMDEAAEALDFERAAELRDQIRSVEQVLQRQKIVSDKGTDADVLAVATGEGDAVVQVAFLRGGKLLGSQHFPLTGVAAGDTAETILGTFVPQFYEAAALVPPLIIAQVAPAEAEVLTDWLRARRGGAVQIVVPQRGERKQLVEMVAKSAVENLEQSRVRWLSDEQKATAAMTELQAALGLDRWPRRIECFDNSNLQGSSPVSSLVVFEDGRPLKSAYKRFHVKTVVGADDFATMREVVRRRFKRAVEQVEAEGEAPSAAWTTLPDLLIIDGGKGQLSAALEAFQELNVINVPVVGLAKQFEEIFLPGQAAPVVLPRDSQALYLIQRIRDEAHRFALAFHQQTRQKAALRSPLDDIKGVGPKRKKALIQHFGSVKRLRAASIDDIAAVDGIGVALAQTIKDALG